MPSADASDIWAIVPEFPRYSRALDIAGGWFQRECLWVLRAVRDRQRSLAELHGAPVGEIGVYEGLSLAAIADCSPCEHAGPVVAVDCFSDDPALNPSQSGAGRGDGLREIFEANMREVGLEPLVLQVSSQTLRPADLMAALPIHQRRRYALWHVDGGHSYAETVHDCRLVIETLDRCGVLIVDDVFNAAWPEVSDAVRTLPQLGWVPFATCGGKAWFCAAKQHGAYLGCIPPGPWRRQRFLGRVVASWL